MATDLMTVEQAAEKLQMHPDTIRRLLREQQIPGVKFGKRQWRISEKALQEYVANGGVAKPRTEPVPPVQSRKLAAKAATDPKFKNKTTGAKKV